MQVSPKFLKNQIEPFSNRRAALAVYKPTLIHLLPMPQSIFSTLNAINCNEHTEKKGNLTYLSWAWAWQIVKSHFPEAIYTIYESPDGWNYFTDGKTCWVKVGVTIQGLEHIEHLPVMDSRNQSILLDNVKSTDINKAIQRALTKACARHGLGLYIYAGEDLPDSEPLQISSPKAIRQLPSPQQTTPPVSQPSWRQSRSQYFSGK